jgi:diacylglycerol kinase (ATP)
VSAAIAVLVNPVAGRGRGARVADVAVTHLQRAGLTVLRLQGEDVEEAAALAHAAVADGVDGLVVVGGDGLVQLGARAVNGTDVPLGVIPAGTGNDTARALGIDRKDVASAADVIVAGHQRTLDLAEAAGHAFVTVLAAGFDSLVTERANRLRWPRGEMRYNLATLAELRVFRPIRYSLELDGEQRDLEAMLVAVGNTASYGGGLRMCEGAQPDDGLLDVVLIKPVSKPQLIRVFPRLYRGTHVTHPQFERVRVRSVTIAAPGIVGYADGERVGHLPLTIRALPGAMRVFAPAPPPGAAADVR